jgi:hypothetical protein
MYFFTLKCGTALKYTSHSTNHVVSAAPLPTLHTQPHMSAHAHAHAHVHAHAHAHAHMCMCMCMHIHVHAHMHMCMCMSQCLHNVHVTADMCV